MPICKHCKSKYKLPEANLHKYVVLLPDIIEDAYVVRETKTQVIDNGWRVNKISKLARYFDTFEEAAVFLKDNALARVNKLERELDREKKMLEYVTKYVDEWM
jgi:hypothetical protein